MGPANKQWIRSRMAGIKKASGIAFSEEIFLSILICLIAKNKHLVLHTFPEAVPELKSVVEQHCAVVFGLTTATIVCHGHQTKTDIIGAITGRHADMATHTNGVSQYPYSTHTSIASHHHHSSHHHPSLHSQHHHQQTTPSGHYYQYSNPGDEYSQRSKTRLEKARRSVATNYSEASEISHRVSDSQHNNQHGHHHSSHHHHQATPSIGSVRTSERDSRQLQGYHLQGAEDPGDDASSIATTLRRSDSRAKGSGRPGTSMSQVAQESIPMETLGNNKRPNNQYLQTPAYMTGGASSGGSGSGSGVGKGTGSIHSSHAPVTPVDFTFPRRRHESVSIQAGYGQGGGGGELPTGVTYGGRKIAQAIILDGLENASQEVYAVLLEMIINKGINDRNRYELPDLIIIAVFSSQNVPDNIPKQLDWDELSKRMKAVTVSNDMMRYIRDVIVGVRTHEAVHGGLTARAALDLELIMKTLAAIFQTTFVTPELLVTAAEKVFSHRVQLKSTRRKKLLLVNNYYNNNNNNNNNNNGTHHSPPPTSHGKTPLHGSQAPPVSLDRQESFGSSARRQQQQQEGGNDGASFVEISDSEDASSSSSSSVHQVNSQPQRSQHQKSGETQSLYLDEPVLGEDTEKTAADVVKDVLKAVYPPI
ncbi:hypothetical protein BG005_004146 [Podila minutissima]|nr:hypothetical protein BG005_004146 [Podila minutissima]